MARRVFVSSTHDDLISYREEVARRLDREGFGVLRMETMTARSEEPVEACIQDVVRADFFVGIYAWRYGHVPAESPFSITERELLTAETLGRPILAFVADESLRASWPAEHVADGEGARRLAELKARLRRERTVKIFCDPCDLANKIYAALKERVDREADFTPGRRLLIDLWRRVQKDWLEGVLWPAVPEGRRIEIGREERPQAVGRPIPMATLAPRSPVPPVAEPIYDFFEKRVRTLLILGEPGAGKTIALLELARELGRLARASSEMPIPVVFNLASWRRDLVNRVLPAQPRPWQLADWMAGQLQSAYGASETQAVNWVDQILPLLDGLDEVAADYRADCVEAINAYLAERGVEARIAVCCRTDVYEYEKLLLGLESALVLQPLTSSQVDDHLASGGPELTGLRAAISESSELQEIATSPLLLSFLEQTYYGTKLEEIGVRKAEEVMAEYVTKALEPWRPPPLPTRRPSLTNRWLSRRRRLRGREPAPGHRRRVAAARRVLSWLAHRMAEHNPSLFQIERLQPSWLESRARIWAYALISRAIGGALIALPLAWFYPSIPLVWILFMGILPGAVAGAVDAITLQRSTGRHSDARRGLQHPLVRGPLVGVGTALMLLLFHVLWGEELTGYGPGTAGFRSLLKATILLAAWIGFSFGSRGASRGRRHDVRVAETLSWRRWSMRATLLGACWGVFVGAAFSAIARMTPELRRYEIWTWLLLMALLGGFGGLLGGAVGGIGRRPLERNLWPNHGTWRGLFNTVKVSLGAGSATTLALALLIAIDQVLGNGGDWRQDLSSALRVGLAVGFWLGLGFGGLDFVQHFTLRVILRLTGCFPPGLVRFLDNAIDRRLLQRLGGSYKFYHPLLLRYFAQSQDRGHQRADPHGAAPRAGVLSGSP